jgi:DNA-binding response OmpR family regulator
MTAGHDAKAVVALVEDDVQIQRAVAHALEQRGHVVRAFGDPVVALPVLTSDPPDIVVLDLGLPNMDGTDFLRMLRSVHDIPVLVATARDDDDGIVRTLDQGADDYIVKPFSADQLDARIRAVLRRTKKGGRRRPLVIGGLEIDPVAHEVRLDGASIEMNRKEFEILAYLANRPGEVVSKRDLARDVWHRPAHGSDKTIDVHLSWIRRKLGETPSEPRYLHTVRGVGVRLVAPEDR